MGNGGIALPDQGVQVSDHLVSKLLELHEQAALVFLRVEFGELELQLFFHCFDDFRLIE